MGREIYTFKINYEKIRSNLIPRLKNDIYDIKSFYNYIINRVNPDRELRNQSWKINAYSPFNPLQIVEILESNQTNYSSNALGLAFDWLWDLDDSSSKSAEMYNSTLDHFGFELVYELWTKDKCWVYLNLMSEFEDMNGFDDKSHCYDGMYHLYSNSIFKRYLNYLLVLLKKISLDTQYANNDIYYSENELSFFDDGPIDEVLEQQTNQALTFIRKENEQEDVIEKNEINYRRPNDKMHYHIAPEMFFQIKELQATLKNYGGKVFVFDNH